MAATSEPLWTITDQLEATERGPDGRPGPGVRLFFRTVSGKAGSVFVPNSHLSEANVRAAVTQRAQLLERLGTLTP